MIKYWLNLKLFDDGGGAAAGTAGAEGAAAGGSDAQKAEVNEPQDPSLARKARIKAVLEKANGQQADGSAVVTEDKGSVEEPTGAALQPEAPKALTPEERKAEFERLISGEYKDLYTERMNSALSRRFKASNTANEQITAMQPIIQMVAERYGVDAKDLAAVSKALENDNAALETEAATKGMDVEQLKEIKRLRRENEQYRQASEQAQIQQEAESILNGWIQQGEQMKATYPAFDFDTEMANPQFVELLKRGVSVDAAYKVIHMDDIVGGAMQYTAQKVQKATVDGIRSRAARPSENGTSAQAGAKIGKYRASTRQDRMALAARSMAGEQITF